MEGHLDCFHILAIVNNAAMNKEGEVVLVIKNLPANAGDIRDVGSIPRLGRSPGGEHSNSFQYSCLESPMGRGTWWATVHGVAKSQTPLTN